VIVDGGRGSGVCDKFFELIAILNEMESKVTDCCSGFQHVNIYPN
jgi:hypothetical protein